MVLGTNSEQRAVKPPPPYKARIMSFKLTALMLDHGPADPLAKLLAMALCDRADEHGVCWPSRADLVSRTGASTATISRKLRLLEVQGYIQRQQRFNETTRFRVNALKLHQMEAAAQAAKLVTVPKGFEPFQEELDTVKLPQVIENKGDDHSDHADDHSDHADDHGDQLTYQKSINQPRLRRASSKSDLSDFQKSSLLAGRSFQYRGKPCLPGSSTFESLRQAVRAQDAMKRGV